MRRRILLLVVATATLVVLAFAIPLAILIRHNTYADGIRALERQANELGLYLQQNPSPAQLASYITDEVDAKYRAGVVLPNGGFVGRAPPDSETAPEPSEPAEGDGPDRLPPRRTTTIPWHGGQLAQVQSGTPDAPSLVRVWTSDSALHVGERRWFALLAGVAVALLLLGLAGGEILTRRIVRPLLDTAHTARRLSVGDTAARAPTTGPGEVAEVARALNVLADRIDELIAEERETIADLSHRLRTPLTALRLDAEALRDPAEAERMSVHAGTLERMLTAVIRTARRPQREGRLPSCDATEVVRERVAFWSALTEDQERPSTIELPNTPLTVRAAAEDLAEAVNALLENIIAHTPEGTPYTVRLGPRAGGGARLVIADEGPGISTEQSVRGRSDRGSTGLGLDIARRCAEASGGTMTISRGPSGGAVVTLDLGGDVAGTQLALGKP